MAAAADGNGYVEIDPTGRYGRFNEVLGKGAMKTVYRAFDELNGMEVAWNQAKVYDVVRSPEAMECMYSEVNLLGTLKHESIIRFYTSWVDFGRRTFNFITEMFTSGTLREYRRRYRQVDIRAVKNWARQVLHGLVYLHGHDPPVIHRDLKCDNIFVNGHLGQVKIGDLGLAAVLQNSQNAHSIIGTPEFMAPELYEEEYNELVDIYSFGMCVLEMLTAEYPYTECSNPAQIYKKVTSGRRPDAFHRIQNLDAKRFIGRCLEKASNRSSARELLLDPFLISDDRCILTISEMPELSGDSDMTITGKMNPEDDTIFLNVQIADKDGHVRNIYFPFDIVNDTPVNVANEMVRELEIIHRDPSEIAEVIAQEISYLVPDWSVNPPENHQPHQIYSYGVDREDNEVNHPFHYLSSPASSYASDFRPGSYQQQQGVDNAGWIREGVFSDDDDSSSLRSGMFSATYYPQDNPPSLHRAQSILQDHNSTEGSEGNAMLATNFGERCNLMAPWSSQASKSHGGKKASGSRQLRRNKSMIDTRSQLLNRTLIEGFKKRLFKTVGAVEHIGLHIPLDDRSGKSPSSRGDRKKHGS